MLVFLRSEIGSGIGANLLNRWRLAGRGVKRIRGRFTDMGAYGHFIFDWDSEFWDLEFWDLEF